MATGDGPSRDGAPAGVGLPIGVERALTRATGDDEFRADLLKRRVAAAEEAGIELTTAERAVLESVDDAQLNGMIDRLAGRVVEIPTPQVTAPPAGIRPGPPVAQGIRPEPIAGIGQDGNAERPGGFHPELTRGTRPDAGAVKGIRPGLPIALAAGAVMVGGACATIATMSAGSRPDEPPEPEPTEPQAPPGEAQASDPPDGGTPDGGDGGTAPEKD